MSFANIPMLWLIWAVPVLLAVGLYGIRKRAAVLAAYAAARGRAAIAPEVSPVRQWARLLVLMGAILFAILSLAGPQYGFHWKEIERRGVDLVIALDCSKSMLANDIAPSRLERAKREVIDLLAMVQGDRVGLVAFAGTAFLQCPLTLDYDGFHLFLNTLTPDYLPVGGTNITAAITTAMAAFKTEDATDKAVLLITDGQNTGDSPREAVARAAAAGIKLFCIGVGEKTGVPISNPAGGYVKDNEGHIVLTELDAAALKQMAAATGGAYVRSVAGDMDLDTLYRKHIRGTMQTAALGTHNTRVLENRYQWSLGLAVALLVLEMVLPLHAARTAVVLLALLTLVRPGPAGAGTLKNSISGGEAAYARGDYDQAARHYTAAQLEAPDRPELFYNLGNVRYKTGDYQGALAAWQQALETEDDKLRQKTRYNMGNAHFRTGNLDAAIAAYASALELDATDHEARENLAFVKQVKAQPPPPDPSGGKNRQDGEEAERNRRQPENGADADSDGQHQAPGPSAGTDGNSGEDGAQPSPSEETHPSPDAAAQPGAAHNDQESRRQAEQMLNRLQDQPGRALVPAYREQRVEKDW